MRSNDRKDGAEMKQMIFTGSAVALVTPMKEDLSINYEMVDWLIRFHLKHHTDAIVVAGTTGEGATLTDEEQEELIRFTVQKVHGNVPVIAGTGSNNTAHAVALSKMAEKAGANALLHVTPYYNKASQKGLVLHFTACAKATALPVILYNVPSRTGVNIEPETYRKLAQIENIAAVKEASGNFSQMAKILSLCGENLTIYSGNDDQITSALALGAKGVISVLANIAPEETHQLCDSFMKGDTAQSDNLQIRYLELIEALFSDINPIPVKQAMNDMGIPVGPCRLPLCSMENVQREHLYQVLTRYGMIPKERKQPVGTVTVHRPKGVLMWRKNP